MVRTQVGAEEIAEVVSRATGIPVSKMLQGEREKLLHMEDVLHQRVVGQDEAVRLVSDAIRRSRAGLGDPNRPYGSFLFLGPTGVGKTELCKALAGFLFDSEDHLIRVDMSEFMEKHSVARLIGAPPGYVGYEEGGYLTEAVRRKPYSVILLDEVEKAHPDVFNVLLQVLDDGRMTDGQGRTVDFKNTVIVMTSNLGSQMIQQMAGSDYQAIKVAVMAEVKNYFRPEFINRIDEVVVFHALDERHIRSIAKIQLGLLERRLAGMDMKLQVTDAAAGRAREGWIRSDLWGAPAEACHPILDRESAREGDSGGTVRPEGCHRRRLHGRTVCVHPREQRRAGQSGLAGLGTQTSGTGALHHRPCLGGTKHPGWHSRLGQGVSSFRQGSAVWNRAVLCRIIRRICFHRRQARSALSGACDLSRPNNALCRKRR